MNHQHKLLIPVWNHLKNKEKKQRHFYMFLHVLIIINFLEMKSKKENFVLFIY